MFDSVLIIAVFIVSRSVGVAQTQAPTRARIAYYTSVGKPGIWIMNEDGTDKRFVITNMNENSGAELLFIDFERDAAEVYRAPAGAGSWALMKVSGDRLIVGTFYDGQFMVFDLKRMEFVQAVGFPGESYIWNLAFGCDGRVYGGTYGGEVYDVTFLNGKVYAACYSGGDTVEYDPAAEWNQRDG